MCHGITPYTKRPTVLYMCSGRNTCNVATLTTGSTPAVEHVGMDGLDVYRLDESRIPQQLSTGVDLKGTALLEFEGGRECINC